MDPHGADQRGNPIGGLLYSQAFGGNITQGQNSTAPWTQVMQWCVETRLLRIKMANASVTGITSWDRVRLTCEIETAHC